MFESRPSASAALSFGLALSLAVASLALPGAPAQAADADMSPVTIHTTEGDFMFIKDDIKNGVLAQGMVIENELDLADMLERTRSDLGYEGAIFERAETIQFCSAALTQDLVRAHPANVVLCPFAVSLFTTTQSPDQVHIAYRAPVLLGGDPALTKRVRDMLEQVAKAGVRE